MDHLRATVYLDFNQRYQIDWLKSFIDRFFQQHQPRSFAGRRVLLKPNLISSRGPRLACSDWRVIRAAAEWFIDQGAQVLVGDSPAFGTSRSVLRNQRIMEHLHDLHLRVIQCKTPIQKTLSQGRKITVCQEALDCDLFVNLPRVKAHSQMYMSLAVKNVFGIVCGMRKALAHMQNGPDHELFGALMLDLVALLPPAIGIIDGIEGMHRTGPLTGELIQLGFVGASDNQLALDSMTHQLLRLDPVRSPVIKAARARALAGAFPEQLDYPWGTVQDFSPPPFVAPDFLQPVPFNPFRFAAGSIKRALGRRHHQA